MNIHRASALLLVGNLFCLSPGFGQQTYRLTALAGDDQTSYSGRLLPRLLEVRIRVRVQDTVSRDLSDSECQQVRVTFTPYVDTKAGASPAGGKLKGSMCVVEAAWQLGKETGEQYLRAVVQSAESFLSEPLRFHASAHAPAQIVFGYAFLPTQIDLDTLRVTQAKLDSAGRRAGARLTVGAEFPVGPTRYSRFFMGISFKHPERELFVGWSSLLPTLWGTRVEDYPLQIVVGVRFQRISITDLARTDLDVRPFLAVTTSGPGLLSQLIGKL